MNSNESVFIFAEIGKELIEEGILLGILNCPKTVLSHSPDSLKEA